MQLEITWYKMRDYKRERECQRESKETRKDTLFACVATVKTSKALIIVVIAAAASAAAAAATAP